MAGITKWQVNAAMSGNDWDLGNKTLYDLCKKNPGHQEKSKIVAKIWLIGRSYAAAIERRKNNGGTAFDGDDFYLEKVVPAILKSDIDDWMKSLKSLRKITNENQKLILLVHYRVTELFSKISGLNKRSLASKYLHFHYPKLFFIYDTRVVSALSHLSDITGRLERATYGAAEVDNEYRKVFEKCRIIRDHVHAKHGVLLTPRTLDNLLLAI